jgi:flavin-dependent dehydrogenase
VGDAADFHDPFTGEGVYVALQGAELLAPHALLAARGSPAAADRALAAWDREWRHAASGRWIVERVVGIVTGCPSLMNRATRALATRRDLADLLVGFTGGIVPAREVVNLKYILSLVSHAH